MRNCFPKLIFRNCVRTFPLVLIALTSTHLLSQAISFSTTNLISYPDTATFYPVLAVPGDMNGDGNTDLVLFTQTLSTVTPYASRLQLLTGDGAGNFTSKPLPITPHPGSKFLVADVNRDGHQDIVYMYGGVAATTSSPGYFGALQVWLGDGAGNFHIASTTPLPVGDVSAELGDFNHDGKPDVAVMTAYDPNSSDRLSHETWLDVFINLGNGSFSDAYTSHDSAAYEHLGPVGDYNRDGNSDLILISESQTTFRVISGNGDGTFVDPLKATYTLDTEYIISMSASDLNGDRKTDLVVSLMPNVHNVPPKIATLLAKQTTGFYWYHDNLPVGFSGQPQYNEAQLADLNGDGRPDIIYVDQDSGNVNVLPGEANALFGPEQRISYLWIGHFVTAPLKTGGLPDIFYFGERSAQGPGFLEVQFNVSK
jgi:hypothetical protein